MNPSAGWHHSTQVTFKDFVPLEQSQGLSVNYQGRTVWPGQADKNFLNVRVCVY